LRAIAGYESIPVVRVPENDTHVIKQFLDLGAQSLIVPMIFTPDDARKAAAAVAYPPQGARGIGPALARSGAWGRLANYVTTARQPRSRSRHRVCAVLGLPWPVQAPGVDMRTT